MVACEPMPKYFAFCHVKTFKCLGVATVKTYSNLRSSAKLAVSDHLISYKVVKIFVYPGNFPK